MPERQPQHRLRRAIAAAAVVITCAPAHAADVTRLTDDGATIVYRAAPGELPGAIAERFGIAPEALPEFLAANGIRDATRVAEGHVYRIPNPLAARAGDAERRASALTREAESGRTRIAALEAEGATLQQRADTAVRRSAELDRLARLWPWMQAGGMLLLTALVGAIYVAHRATRRLIATERYARELSDQVDERRRGGLAERQSAARRILDLEAQVHALEIDTASRRAVRPRPTGTH